VTGVQTCALPIYRYWYGEEFNNWRADYSGFYTVPVLYVWNELVVRAGIGELAAGRAATSAPVEP